MVTGVTAIGASEVRGGALEVAAAADTGVEDIPQEAAVAATETIGKGKGFLTKLPVYTKKKKIKNAIY